MSASPASGQVGAKPRPPVVFEDLLQAHMPRRPAAVGDLWSDMRPCGRSLRGARERLPRT